MSEKRFLLLTFILTVLIGGPAVLSVLREPIQPKYIISGQANSDRAPANVSTETQAREVSGAHSPNAIKAKSVTVELDCEGDEQTQQTDGTLMRIKGDCWKENYKNLSVINKTNGFTASIVDLKSKGFTTDFIDLKEGSNVLEVSGVDLQGKAFQKNLKIERRMPASAAVIEQK